jgi:hypothetical protein
MLGGEQSSWRLLKKWGGRFSGKKTSEVFGKTQCRMKAALEDFGSLPHFFEMIPFLCIFGFI